ncbi:MAG: glycerol-3-phosphate 1-O-acyltransferase PlsY [Oligoflexia bacterium]|nr:glycerol-3-phosphate 1-O-acyltransferase PlsY [Oligoflexia bacterium]
MDNTNLVLTLIGAYLIGSIPFGVIVSRFVSGRDVRAQGSGNIGATNVARMMGKKWGIFVLFLDGLKGFLVVKAVGCFFTEDIFLLSNLAALAAIVGHCFPIYLKFKGGKGVATALGVVTALSPLTLGVCFIVFVLVIGISRTVSLASLAAALALPIVAMITEKDIMILVAAAITLLIWWKHKENIKRLVNRQEPKFF